MAQTFNFARSCAAEALGRYIHGHLHRGGQKTLSQMCVRQRAAVQTSVLCCGDSIRIDRVVDRHHSDSADVCIHLLADVHNEIKNKLGIDVIPH